MKPLFDTNIIIDYLKGAPEARRVIVENPERAISIITWIEVMAGPNAQMDGALRGFLASFDLIDLNEQVAEQAAAIRRTHRLKLPDAIIWASARTAGLMLLTRDLKDFPANDPGILIPYRLG